MKESEIICQSSKHFYTYLSWCAFLNDAFANFVLLSYWYKKARFDGVRDLQKKYIYLFCHRIMQRSLFYDTRCAQNFNYVNNRNLLSSINWNFVRVMNCLSRMTMISNASVRHPSKMQHIDLSRIINVLIDVACWKN